MRKLIIMVVLMLGVSITMFAQDVSMFNVEAITTTTTGDWDDAEDVEMTGKIILSYTDDMITVYWEEVSRKWHVRSSEAIEDDTGEGKMHLMFTCVDSEAVECIVMVSWFEDDTIAVDGIYDYSWKFVYEDLWWAFYSNVL